MKKTIRTANFKTFKIHLSCWWASKHFSLKINILSKSRTKRLLIYWCWKFFCSQIKLQFDKFQILFSLVFTDINFSLSTSASHSNILYFVICFYRTFPPFLMLLLFSTGTIIIRIFSLLIIAFIFLLTFFWPKLFSFSHYICIF